MRPPRWCPSLRHQYGSARHKAANEINILSFSSNLNLIKLQNEAIYQHETFLEDLSYWCVEYIKRSTLWWL